MAGIVEARPAGREGAVVAQGTTLAGKVMNMVGVGARILRGGLDMHGMCQQMCGEDRIWKRTADRTRRWAAIERDR